MDISYNKLFKLLIDKGFKKNETFLIDVIIKLCYEFKYSVEDILNILSKRKCDEYVKRYSKHIKGK